MTSLFSTHPLLTKLNGGSLNSPKVRVINADAFVWLDQNTDIFDFVVVDFPDPNNYGVGKLYTTAFYRALARHVSRGGLFVVQSTSPLFARQSFWSIVATLKQAGLVTYPYHVYVPSFGEWGFTLASASGTPAYTPPPLLPAPLRFLSVGDVPQLFSFPRDMQPVAVEPNRLNDQVLVRYYEKEFEAINR
jgi:spermidine synthase